MCHAAASSKQQLPAATPADLTPHSCAPPTLQRIVTNLQEVVQARGLGLSLPQQLAQPAAAAEGAAAGGAAGGLPLSVLLGGSLMDRMDLLGRTGGVGWWEP